MTTGARRAHRHLQEGHLWRRVAETAAVITALVLLATSDVVHGALMALFQATDRAIETHPVAGPAAFVVFAAASAKLQTVGHESPAGVRRFTLVAQDPLRGRRSTGRAIDSRAT